ncbi:sigma 54 modulation/S30EA ribosomal C-terminal domain-containing protein [Actinoplanes palleronii]|uniref:Sigma 54 modulation/S30EA ribosomal protein C-terminal domain-containing protein n=1 Tax=Actinoplanes palleronii TaxID=113570 RepID=A0ABQ4BBW1_9ACTN|nr:sigma 54 modulation/S30EA ribosomal C-terminal domain-containing protein [Actinoplanes palleronii]GIE68165.1 hypothetical protein Apa02nite_042730 [Actinoplanes palleronii]
MSGPQPTTATGIEVVTHGRVPADLVAYARHKVLQACRHTRRPIPHVRLKLSYCEDTRVSRPARAQANVDLDGRLLRGEVTAPTMREAVDLLEDRLRRRLSRAARHWEARRGSRPGPEGWRHGSAGRHPLAHFPRPAQERQVVRHKSYEPARTTPDEAVFDMDLLDYDVHLFTDETTGQDAVVYRAGPTGYRLARLRPADRPAPATAVPLTVSNRPAPRLTLAEAVDRLNLTDQPFLFFADVTEGRGRLLYHRYDGHYGLITPAG